LRSGGGYLLSETAKSLFRNKASSLLSALTTAFALFLLGVSFLVNLNFRFLIQSAERQMEIQAYLRKDLGAKEAEAIVESVKKMGGVTDVKYVSKEEAFEELKSMFGDKSSVLAGLDQNPLPASIRVKTVSAEVIPVVVSKLKELPQFDDVIYQEEAARRLASIGRVVRLASLGGVVLVGFVAVMVIGNSIRLTIDAKRHEISIMKLVGATDSFITGPFLFQGMILGILGALLGCILAVLLYLWVYSRIGETIPFMPILKLDLKTAGDMLGIMLLTGTGVGVAGSVFSLRRYLGV